MMHLNSIFTIVLTSSLLSCKPQELITPTQAGPTQTSPAKVHVTNTQTSLSDYKANVSSVIQKNWRQNCEQYSDLIIPGNLEVSFQISKNGDVSHIKILKKEHGGHMNKMVVLKSLNGSKFPPFNETILKKLNDDKIEFVMTFTNH